MRRHGTRFAVAAAAAALVGLSSQLPLWTMTMRAPQYPKGLRLHAYGTGIWGDLPEINILNHYLGMPPLETPPLEVAAFPFGIALLIVLCLAAPWHRYLSRLAIAALAVTPLVILGDLQWRLYTFGHSFDPHAPIRLKPFTPPVIGSNTMWNFETSSMIGWGIVCLMLPRLFWRSVRGLLDGRPAFSNISRRRRSPKDGAGRHKGPQRFSSCCSGCPGLPPPTHCRSG
jgi:copper chaperone NosL